MSIVSGTTALHSLPHSARKLPDGQGIPWSALGPWLWLASSHCARSAYLRTAGTPMARSRCRQWTARRAVGRPSRRPVPPRFSRHQNTPLPGFRRDDFGPRSCQQWRQDPNDWRHGHESDGKGTPQRRGNRHQHRLSGIAGPVSPLREPCPAALTGSGRAYSGRSGMACMSRQIL